MFIILRIGITPAAGTPLWDNLLVKFRIPSQHLKARAMEWRPRNSWKINITVTYPWAVAMLKRRLNNLKLRPQPKKQNLSSASCTQTRTMKLKMPGSRQPGSTTLCKPPFSFSALLSISFGNARSKGLKSHP